MRPDEFLRCVKRGALGPVYFFSGPEALVKQQALDAVLALVPEGVRDFNANVFHGFEADLAEVLGAAKTAPFLAPRRVVVLKDIDKMRLAEGRGDLLAAYLQSPSPGSVFVVTAEVEEKTRDLRKRFGSGWTEVAFAALTARDLEGRVRQEAERLGCRIDAEAVAALLATTGADLGRVLGELGKLRSAVGEGGAIGVAEIELHVAGYAHRTLFELVDAVSARDLAGSLRIIGGLTLKPEEWLIFMGSIGKRLRLLWYFAEAERPLPPVFKTWPAKPEDLRRYGRRFTRREIERGLEALLGVDTALKSTALPPRLLFEHFLIGFLGSRPDRRDSLRRAV